MDTVPEVYDRDSFIGSVAVDRISIPELRAVASDRGYEISDTLSDRVYRLQFMRHQLEDSFLVRQ